MSKATSSAVPAITLAAALFGLPAIADDHGLDSFASRPSMDRAELSRLVLERNPTLETAVHALKAAEARVSQESALEDPRLAYSLAPLSVAGPVRFGQVIELSQALPFPGKRGLRGEIAGAEARASREDLNQVRLSLKLTASMLFDDLFVVERAIAINDEHVALLTSLKKSAEAQYVVGRAAQQDPLQAEVELSQILIEKVMLAAERHRIHGRINGLLHRAPQAPIPPAPAELAVPSASPATSEQLQDQALRDRPELAGVRARMSGGEAGVRLARRGYFPDLMVMASYNSMWMDTPHQFMAGVALNLPIQLGARSAAIDESEAKLQGLRSEEASLIDEIRVDVDHAHTELLEGLERLRLFQTRLVPAARDQLAAARAGFEAGKNSFQALVEAQRNLRNIELRAQTAVADIQRRLAGLSRAVGEGAR